VVFLPLPFKAGVATESSRASVPFILRRVRNSRWLYPVYRDG